MVHLANAGSSDDLKRHHKTATFLKQQLYWTRLSLHLDLQKCDHLPNAHLGEHKLCYALYVFNCP